MSKDFLIRNAFLIEEDDWVMARRESVFLVIDNGETVRIYSEGGAEYMCSLPKHVINYISNKIKDKDFVCD